MKHNTISSKKFIKNTVYLIVSALVLVSATFAWFAKNSQADVDVISATINAEQFDVTFFRADVSGDVFVYDQTTEKIEALDLAEKESLDWQSTKNIDISALYPGVYNAFKVVIVVNEDCADSSFDFNGVSCSTEDAANVFDSIFYRAVAVKGENVTIGEQSGNFSFEGPTIKLLHVGDIKKGDVITIYFDIGIPGYDVNGTHNTLRETGAEISIDSVTIS